MFLSKLILLYANSETAAEKGVAKFWLSPVSLASNHGLKAKELSKAIKVIREHAKQMEDKWNECFSN